MGVALFPRFDGKTRYSKANKLAGGERTWTRDWKERKNKTHY